MQHDPFESLEQGEPKSQPIERTVDTARKHAIALLARRDYSAAELQRRLTREGWQEDDVRQALEQAAARGYLDTNRFAQGLVRRKSEKLGTARVVALLKNHEVEEGTRQELVEQLKATEFARAYAVWQRKFSQLPQDANTKAKHMRFLLSRGFSSAVISKILAGHVPDEN